MPPGYNWAGYQGCVRRTGVIPGDRWITHLTQAGNQIMFKTVIGHLTSFGADRSRSESRGNSKISQSSQENCELEESDLKAKCLWFKRTAEIAMGQDS